MRRRSQRRHRAILPVKIVADGIVLMGHTVDISASGGSVILLSELTPGSTITVEYKHRRAIAKIVWCRPAKGRKYEHELGLKLRYSGHDFWGVTLPGNQSDLNPDEIAEMPFATIMTLISPKRFP